MINTQSYIKHRFDEKDYLTIFNKVIGIFPFPKILSSFLIALLIYLFGLLYSLVFGFSNLYLHTYLFIHSALAIFLSFYIITSSNKEIIDLLILVRPCFSVNDKLYVVLIKKWMKTLFKGKSFWIIWLLLTILIVWGIVSIFYPYPFIYNLLQLLSTAPLKEVLSSEWFIGINIPKLVLIITMLIIPAAPLSLGISGMVVLLPLINEFISLDVIPIPGVLLTLLRKPTELFLRVSIIWLILTASTGFTLLRTVDWFAILLLLIIGSGGIIAFFIPQFAFHSLLVKSHFEMSHMAVDGYNKLKNNKNNISKRKTILIDYVREISDQIKPKSLWVFDVNDIVLLLLGQILSLVGGLWQNFFH